MTVTAPDYTARIIGTPDIPVSLRTDAGTITLDASRAPHVTSTVTIGMPDAALLDDLDPRDNRRLVIEAGGRAFDLGIRDVTPNRADATVRVACASDEALAGDHRPLTGADMIDYADDVQALCEAVLLDVLGTAETVSGPTGDVTPLWDVTNLVPYPTGHSGINGWTTSTGATNLTAVAPPVAPPIGTIVVRWRANTGASIVQCGGWNGVAATKVCAVTPGRQYTASIYLLSTTARNATIRLAFRDENGAAITAPVFSSDPVMTSTTSWTRLSITGTPPATARYAYIIVDTQGNTDGQLHYGTAVMLTEGPFLPAPYTGSTADSADYTYAWDGPADASVSTRTAARDAPARDALYWQAGISAIEFLAPLVQALGLRLVCDEQRAWSLRDASYRADGGLTFRYGVNIVTASEELSRGDEDWYQGAVFRYTWQDRDDIEHTRDDVYVLPGTTNPKVILRDLEAPYPGPGRAQYAVERAQGRGRTVTATKQATWTETAEQPLTARLEGTPIQTGVANRVEFDLETNTVTVTSRTTDTPAAAWTLIPGGEAWIDSPVGESWTEEII